MFLFTYIEILDSTGSLFLFFCYFSNAKIIIIYFVTFGRFLADFWQFLTIFGSLQEGNTRSTLTISNAQREDAGNYTCKPSNAIASSIQVFVSEGMFRFTKEFCNRGRGLSATLPLQTSLMFTTCLEIAWSQLWSSTF